MRFFITHLFVLMLFGFFATAQDNSDVSTHYTSSAESVKLQKGVSSNTNSFPVSLYKSFTVQSQNLYNGRLYYLYDPKMDEHQFFGERKWQKGVVYYDGQRFDSIDMKYDIVRDELVIKHFNGDHILLQAEKVDYFLKDSHTFKRMVAGENISPQMRTGYYDILYDGKLKAMVRRSKQRQEKIVEKQVISLFPEKDFYYIKKDSIYHSVRSKRSVLGLFPDQKKILRKALRDENIKFRQNRDLAILKIVATYDSLDKP